MCSGKTGELGGGGKKKGRRCLKRTGGPLYETTSHRRNQEVPINSKKKRQRGTRGGDWGKLIKWGKAKLWDRGKIIVPGQEKIYNH